MGLFSSIGGILGGAVGSVIPGVGTIIGAGLGSALGDAVDSNRANKKAEGYYNEQMDFAREQMQFQQDYAKNVAQWRVEDAKKAGLHPMAALGISSPNYSPVSAPSSPSYSTGSDIDPMEFGQSLNYAATKAKDADNQQQMVNLQIEGMRLDNDYKRAQIEQLQVDNLASSIASNQAFASPASPVVNSDSPVNLPSDSIFGKTIHRLYHLSQHGDTRVLVLNPEISDAISESQVNNLIAIGAREIETGQNHQLIDDIIASYPKDIQKAVARGEMRLVSVPGSGAFRISPVGENESFNRYDVYNVDLKK